MTSSREANELANLYKMHIALLSYTEISRCIQSISPGTYSLICFWQNSHFIVRFMMAFCPANANTVHLEVKASKDKGYAVLKSITIIQVS